MSSGGAGSNGRAAALSARGSRIAGGARGLLDKGFDLYIADPFDRDRNPRGILNLGTSENKLCYDLIQERLTRPDMNYLEPHLLQYSDTQGIESFREEIAKFLTEYAKAPKALNPEHIVVMSGCCAVFATLSTVLCDPGDGYLIPTPYYGGINSKTWLYGGIQPVHVPLFSEVTDEESHPFQLTVEKLETALQRAKEQVGMVLTDHQDQLCVFSLSTMLITQFRSTLERYFIWPKTQLLEILQKSEFMNYYRHAHNSGNKKDLNFPYKPDSVIMYCVCIILLCTE